MQNDIESHFSARMAHWTAQGFSGDALYEKLAQDDALPCHFSTKDLAKILGITELSVKKARHRGAGPAYSRLTKTKGVRYARHDFCQWLARRYVRAAA